jgi:hypothetical protein
MNNDTLLSRRKFINIAGLSLGAATLSSTIIGCDAVEPTLDYGWKTPFTEIKDIRLRLLSYAILSPNPHNKQPWNIQLTGENSFELYVDPSRLLPATDPYYRQIHIGQGTFLETLVIAATGFGYQADIKYFPQGEYGNNELKNKPIASITLDKNPKIKVDPLFDHLLTRQSNKSDYLNRPLSQLQLNELHSFNKLNKLSNLTLVNSPKDKLKLEQVLTDAMKIEVGDLKREHETISMFRFNQEEINKYRDGFGLAQSGVTGFKKILLENLILSRESVEKDPTSFSQEAVNIVHKSAVSTATFAWLTTTHNTRLDQVKVGREYCRINLKTTAMGLSQHPMSQVLQEYSDVLPLQKDFKEFFNIKKSDTVQMLFRLGEASPVEHSPRRLLQSMIRV